MLRPIPRQILSETMVLHVPTSCDADYNTQYNNVIVNRVHLQDDYSIVRTEDNNEIQCKGILFIDGRLSSPKLNYTALQKVANEIGARMRVSIGDYNYEILTIDAVPDDHGQLHHWEIAVV